MLKLDETKKEKGKEPKGRHKNKGLTLLHIQEPIEI